MAYHLTVLELVGGAPAQGWGGRVKIELAYRHTRIWQADELHSWQAARSVGSVGRCTRKSRQLVNAKLIRELLRPLRVLALVCNLAAFTASLHS